MSKEIRTQYHFRETEDGVTAFDVLRLIELSKDLPVREIDPAKVQELDENHWYRIGEQQPTPRSLLEHMRLIRECDLRYPIILDSSGRVMDGMHRVCKALLEGLDHVPAVQFDQDPEPDYVNCAPEDLPYDA